VALSVEAIKDWAKRNAVASTIIALVFLIDERIRYVVNCLHEGESLVWLDRDRRPGPIEAISGVADLLSKGNGT
jgi:hypothetical protein